MRFVLALLLFVRLAHADVGVVVSGDPNMQARVLEVAQRWLQDKKQSLVAAPLGTVTSTFIDCFVIDDMPCAKKLFDDKATATTVVFVRVDMAAGQSRDYTITAYWFTKGSDPVNGKRACAQCDDTVLAATLDGLMRELSRKGAHGKGQIKIGGGGGGMSVKIDGTEAALPLDREIDAGSHELVFVQDGSPVDVRRVEVDAGGELELQAPHLADHATAPAARHSRMMPALLMVGGAALAAAGGVFLYYGSLRGRDEPYVYTNATEIGLPLALVGAFAFGAGTSLFFSAGGSSDARVGVAGTF